MCQHFSRHWEYSSEQYKHALIGTDSLVLAGWEP